jgi:hypothetical protein
MAVVAAKTARLRFRPGPTVTRFLASGAFLRQLIGPRGAGKTTAALYAWWNAAVRQSDRAYWPLRVAVVRDTYQALLDKLVPDLARESQLRGLPIVGVERKGPRTLQVGPGPLEFVLFGMDTLPDSNRFLGLNIGGLWLEEPAPARDVTSGIPQEALALGISSLREPRYAPQVILTQTPRTRSTGRSASPRPSGNSTRPA